MNVAALTTIQGTGYPNSTLALICALEWKPGANTTGGQWGWPAREYSVCVWEMKEKCMCGGVRVGERGGGEGCRGVQ